MFIGSYESIIGGESYLSVEALQVATYRAEDSCMLAFSGKGEEEVREIKPKLRKRKFVFSDMGPIRVNDNAKKRERSRPQREPNRSIRTTEREKQSAR